MQILSGPASSVAIAAAIGVVLVILIAYIWYNKRTKGGRRAP